MCAAYRKQYVKLSANHMELRRPEGLDQSPFLIQIENQVLFHILFKKVGHIPGFPHIETHIIQVVIC